MLQSIMYVADIHISLRMKRPYSRLTKAYLVTVRFLRLITRNDAIFLLSYSKVLKGTFMGSWPSGTKRRILTSSQNRVWFSNSKGLTSLVKSSKSLEDFFTSVICLCGSKAEGKFLRGNDPDHHGLSAAASRGSEPGLKHISGRWIGTIMASNLVLSLLYCPILVFQNENFGEHKTLVEWATLVCLQDDNVRRSCVDDDGKEIPIHRHEGAMTSPVHKKYCYSL